MQRKTSHLIKGQQKEQLARSDNVRTQITGLSAKNTKYI